MKKSPAADRNTEKVKRGVFEIGFFVALTLKQDTAPLDCYVGKVQAVSSTHIRITLIDWIIGTANSWDLSIPMTNIDSALVATPEHDIKSFGEAAAEWQKRVKHMRVFGEIDRRSLRLETNSRPRN